MRLICRVVGLTAISLVAASSSLASDLIYGCLNRPTRGKYCKLVCETTKLTAVGYGCKCETICVPGPSKPVTKHCATTCCCDSDIEGCPPRIEFCWYDWFTCGCARPRTVKVLTKYQAEQEICWYHWEVVDACEQGSEAAGSGSSHASLQFPHVYKAAPADALPGDVLPISDAERATLAAYLPPEEGVRLIRFAGDGRSAPQRGESGSHRPQAPVASEPADPRATSLGRRLVDFFSR